MYIFNVINIVNIKNNDFFFVKELFHFTFYNPFFLDLELVFFSFFFSFILAIIILGLTQILNKISLDSKVLKLEIYKVRAYECGFDAFQLPRLSFIIHFFLIAIFFLIFDLEIIILFPLVFCISNLTFYNFLLILVFIYIIIISFFYEIQLNSLTWKFLKEEDIFIIEEFSIFL